MSEATPPPDTLPPPPRRKESGGVTILVLPDGGGGSRTFRLSSARVRALKRGAWLAGALALVLAVSWVALAWHAARTAGMAAELAEARDEVVQVRELARSLEEVETAYARLRGLFGAAAGDAALSLFPEPQGGTSPSDPSGVALEPGTWPLTTRGFLTQPLLAEGSPGRDHPGVDVAVPSGSYFRAAGEGRVSEAGFDDVYGWFVRLDHGGGLETVYAHAEHLAVAEGDPVLAGEVLGLTGSTGQSTAPHLHFELLRDGVPLDPLAQLERP